MCLRFPSVNLFFILQCLHLENSCVVKYFTGQPQELCLMRKEKREKRKEK